MISKQAMAEIKREMNYHDGDECCKNCQHFESANSRCDINIFYVPVSAKGWCKHGTHVPQQQAVPANGQVAQ